MHLTRLTLTAFRNITALDWRVAPRPVVLWGANGSGKTNILEAMSLLSPGRGLAGGNASEWQQHNNPTPWAIAAEVQTPSGFVQLATGRDSEDATNNRRLVRIDGKNTNQAALAAAISLIWLVPTQDNLLASGNSARRKLIDRLVFGFDAAHATRVNRYERAAAERLRLLQDGPATPAWLNALEDDMAQTAVAIAAARALLLDKLTEELTRRASPFPTPNLAWSAGLEAALADKAAVLVEEDLRATLARERGRDGAAGRTLSGLSQSILSVTHHSKNMPAELCSTGEQKALLVRLMLAYAHLLAGWRGAAPLLLLDDLASHLDASRRHALFDELVACGSQFWLTGTEAELFAPLTPHAQFVQIRAGEVVT
jgi:DNA replication and repair protein RecF